MASCSQSPTRCPRRCLRKDTFAVEESTIEGVHRAIQSGATTCKNIVQSYVDRARAYNGICTRLVTKDGAPVKVGPGPVRAGAPLKFPKETVAVSSILPNFSEYKGLPIEYGRMEPTQSDPGAQQQYGMVVGMSNAGQVNALSTLNLRGERSVTCKAKCDLHPSKGALPKSCPAACDAFRKQPDALERAAELDAPVRAQSGSRNDADVLRRVLVQGRLRHEGHALDRRRRRELRDGCGARRFDHRRQASREGRDHLREGESLRVQRRRRQSWRCEGNHTRSTAPARAARWPGVSCNPYDTARETGGSSSGSASSVGANLVNCSICEETGGSCRQPAWRNGVVGFMVTKGMMPYGGSIGADPYVDRAGIHCRNVNDSARVLDALRSPKHGNFFDSRDIYTALPKGLVPKEPYASFATPASGAKPLAGMRIGIVREYMVKHSANDVAMSDRVNEEIKRVLRDQLGAEIVESFDPMYPDDPSIPNMKYDFRRAMAEVLPQHMPNYLAKETDGKRIFDADGQDVVNRDYLAKAAEGELFLSDKLNLRSINRLGSAASFSLHMATYLKRRGDEKVFDWSSLNANTKNYEEGRSVAMKNWENKLDTRSDGIAEKMQMREVMRTMILKVMYENDIDVFVNPTITVPPAKNGYASQPQVNDRPIGRFPLSANAGIPEVTVPAGFNQIIFEPAFALNEAKDKYISVANETTQTTMDAPMPFGISFWGGPGDEPVVLKIAATYEAATKHRAPPPAFGPLKGH